MIFVLLALIALTLAHLQVIRGSYFRRQGKNNALRMIPFEGERGRILDRNGKVLADVTESWVAALIPQDLAKEGDVFLFLAEVLGEGRRTLERRFEAGRLSPFSPVTVSGPLTRDQAIRIEEGAYLHPGLVVMRRFARRYPAGEVTSHLLGYVAKPDAERMRRAAREGLNAEEPVGYAGAEEAFEPFLRGEPGGRQIEVDSRGRQVRLVSMREPGQGQDLTLSVDLQVQRAAFEALGGERGAVAIIDPDTGEVLALVSSPAYDPNAFVLPGSRSKVGGYLSDPRAPLFNRALSASFPPGSLFKIPVAVAALEEKKIKPATTFDCPGTFEIGGRVFRSPHAWGRQDLFQAMGHSANEYFFHSGLRVGPDQMARYARLLGLGERTGDGLWQENRGNIPSRSSRMRWFKGDTVNMSIGQGDVLVTPLQIARMMAAFANGGHLVRTRLLKAVDGKIGTVPIFSKNRDSPYFPTVSSVKISLRDDTWKALKQALYAPVRMPDGTARLLDMSGFDTFGKTGTAQAGAGKSDHAWFAGVTRTSKGRIAYCLLLEHGGSSTNAVAAVKRMLERLMQEGVL
ncbi:MAG: penicillin-binding protein 2 [Elusimicrobia bacterium]|nr:penicillin-binding protein 2 [Elusimicrobiota bacterium]